MLPLSGWLANIWTQWRSASIHAATLTVWEMLNSFSTARTFCMHLLSASVEAATRPSCSSCISSPLRLPPSAPLPQGLWGRLTASSSRMASVKVHRRRSSLCRAPCGSACSILFCAQPTNPNLAWQQTPFFLHLHFASHTFTTNALSGLVHRLFILEGGPPCCHWLLLCTANMTLRATAVFICLPAALRNVAKAKAGGLVGRNKRTATLHKDSCEERSAHPALRYSSLSHFTAPLSACHRHIRSLTAHLKSVFPEKETQSRE